MGDEVGTIRVQLLISWRGHRYGDIVDMPDDDHTYEWLGQGLCTWPDDGDDWFDEPEIEPEPEIETEAEGGGDGVLREADGDESGTPDPDR